MWWDSVSSLFCFSLSHFSRDQLDALLACIYADQIWAQIVAFISARNPGLLPRFCFCIGILYRNLQPHLVLSLKFWLVGGYLLGKRHRWDSPSCPRSNLGLQEGKRIKCMISFHEHFPQVTTRFLPYRALWIAPRWNLSMETQMVTQQSCQVGVRWVSREWRNARWGGDRHLPWQLVCSQWVAVEQRLFSTPPLLSTLQR